MKHYKPRTEEKPKVHQPRDSDHQSANTSSQKSDKKKFNFNVKHKPLIITCIVILIIGFILGALLTNSALKTLNDSLSTKLNAQEDESRRLAANLADREVQITQLNAEIAKKQSILSTKDQDLASTQTALETQKATNNNLNLENNDLKNDVSVLENDVENAYSIVESSVSAVCCSFQDAQQGSILNWRIRNGEIDCSDGDSTVDCQTGSTEFVE